MKKIHKPIKIKKSIKVAIRNISFLSIELSTYGMSGIPKREGKCQILSIGLALKYFYRKLRTENLKAWIRMANPEILKSGILENR
jgi:hypothetical protein